MKYHRSWLSLRVVSPSHSFEMKFIQQFVFVIVIRIFVLGEFWAVTRGQGLLRVGFSDLRCKAVFATQCGVCPVTSASSIHVLHWVVRIAPMS